MRIKTGELFIDFENDLVKFRDEGGKEYIVKNSETTVTGYYMSGRPRIAPKIKRDGEWYAWTHSDWSEKMICYRKYCELPATKSA